MRSASDRLGFLFPLFFLAVVLVEKLLAQTDRLRCDLDEFVILDIGKRFFKRHADRWRQPHGLVLGRRTDIGELLALEYVDDEIVATRMLAHDHSVINFPAWLDHHWAAVFKIPQRVRDGVALFIGNKHAIATALDRSFVWRISMEQTIHDRGTTRVGEQFALIADETACRRMKDKAQAAAARRLHFHHVGFAFRHLLYDDSGMFLIEVDDNFLDRLQHFAGSWILLEQYLRTRHGKLEAFAPHRFNKDTELQFAAACDFHGILFIGFTHAQC